MPPSIETALGNLYQDRNNLQATKQVKSELKIEEEKYFYPDIETMKTPGFFATIVLFKIKRKGSRDLTGAFPHDSIQLKLYATVMYDMILMQS